MAVIGPIPRRLSRRRASASARANVSICRSRSATRPSRCTRILAQTTEQQAEIGTEHPVDIFDEHRQRTAHLPHPLSQHDAVLGQQAANLIDLGRAVANQLAAHPVQCLNILLRYALDLHETHVGPIHRFADRLGIVRVVLVALHVRLDELRGIGRSPIGRLNRQLSLAARSTLRVGAVRSGITCRPLASATRERCAPSKPNGESIGSSHWLHGRRRRSAS